MAEFNDDVCLEKRLLLLKNVNIKNSRSGFFYINVLYIFMMMKKNKTLFAGLFFVYHLHVFLVSAWVLSRQYL